MEVAKQLIHKVFVKYASDSPRFTELTDATPLELSLQMDVYRLGSRAHRVVRRRASMAEGFFEDLCGLGWCYSQLKPFQVAAWVRGRVIGGPKSAASDVAQILRLIGAAADVQCWFDHPIVKGQLQACDTAEASEPFAKAKDIDVEIILKLEEFIVNGATIQVRMMSGVLVLMAASSLRASDVLRTRGLKLTADSVTGVSRLKGIKHWVRWFCDRRGFSGRDWAASWYDEMTGNSLLGPDFLLPAPNSSLTGWMQRPCEYAHVRRALHTLLLAVGLAADEAVQFNPHGLRHVLVTSGQQLRSLGLMTEDDIERLGHWSRNSSMTRRYDNAAGTSERMARETVMRAFRCGWRPAKDGCMPSMPALENIPSKVAQEFVPAPLPSGALEPGPRGLAYHQRSGNGNLNTAAQELVPGSFPPGALEQKQSASVYLRRGSNRKRAKRSSLVCQELVPVPPSGDALEQGPGDPVYHRCRSSAEASTSSAMAQELVPVPSQVGALEQSRFEIVYHQRRKRHHKTVLGSGISLCRMWSCGTNKDPSKDARFVATSDVGKQCATCWS